MRTVAVAHAVLAGGAITVAACGGSERPTASPEGEPMTARLVFKDAAGRELTTDALKGASGNVGWEVIGADAIPPEAARLHVQAREAGGRGGYARALVLLEHAHRLAPDWPYPVYDSAYTYLLQGDATKAEELYAQVDRMAPRGYSTAKASLDCLRRERAGAVPAGFCRAFALLELSDDNANKRALLEGIVEKSPTFPPAWWKLSGLLDDDEARLRAIARGLEHDPDPETKGMLLISRALVLHGRGDRDGAVSLLGALALDPQSTLGTEMLAKNLLANVVR